MPTAKAVQYYYNGTKEELPLSTHIAQTLERGPWDHPSPLTAEQQLEAVCLAMGKLLEVLYIAGIVSEKDLRQMDAIQHRNTEVKLVPDQ